MALPFTRDDVHILVIDDDAMQLTVVSKSLVSLGYKATNACNGKEALDILNTGVNIDLILSDVMMPVMDGPTFLSAARSDPRFSQIPIIMMSSNDQYEIVFNCLAKGADDYMIKPLSPQVLKNIYANIWLKRKQQAAAAKVQNQIVSSTALTKQIQQFKTSLTQSIQTPIQDITTSLEALLNNPSLPPDAAQIISQSITKLKNLEENKPQPFLPRPQVPAKMQSYFATQFGVNSGSTVTPITVPTVRKRFGAPVPVPERPLTEVSQLQSLNYGPNLLQLHFNSWNVKESLLINLANDLLTTSNFTSIIGVKPGELEHFLKLALQRHNPNPFNNFRRSCDCLQFTTYILTKIQSIKFSDTETIGLLLSALLHDIEHPGTNNLFQIHTCSQISLTYNDRHPIESNSASVSVQLVQDCFSYYNKLIELKQIIINCILITDYSKLQKFLIKLSSIKSFDFVNNKNHRLFALQLLMLMGDLSFAIRKWNITNYWYQMLRDEKYLQGDMERRLGMQVDPLMDRRQISSRVQVVKAHYKIVVVPVFQEAVRVFPEMEEEILKALQENLSIIEEMDSVEKENDNNKQ
ncbi:cAMP phosphodiesterase [Histomonas meleagridis]|uniref:cAMP phosphodiesterase n=1 Tax=Histomonas meleagridis TaxID=135588 RepID=UPI00355995BA|nr:cAMP phosphodiesterase [Histomonas meleagridis]KAH0802493.1 cAMP phosphodiesterase [Histomonas meleagridis]